MQNSFDALWVNVSPSLKVFDLPLQQYLSRYCKVVRWEYVQTLDEESCLEKAVTLLYDFIKSHNRQVHLIGHGISGVVALIFTRRYPHRVRSLTLLAVAPNSEVTWHAHYYTQRHLFYNLTCNQLLAIYTHALFGNYLPYPVNTLVNALKKDLEESPSMHSLFNLKKLPLGKILTPLIVCGSKTDPVVSPPDLFNWMKYFKPGDTVWESPDGYHFFHYYYPELVGEQILNFWRNYPM